MQRATAKLITQFGNLQPSTYTFCIADFGEQANTLGDKVRCPFAMLTIDGKRFRPTFHCRV